MAQITYTLRVILIPLLSDDHTVASLFSIPALVQAATNGWFVQMWATVEILGGLAPPGAADLVRGVRAEFLTTAANDVNLVATSLPALQAQLGLPTPLTTWSEVVTGGY